MRTILTKTNCLEKCITDKAEKWIQSFINEMELFEIANSWEESWRVYKEEPLLSLLSTGLARNDTAKEISILREYPVYVDGGYIGNSDLFLNYFKENKHFYFEAKYEKARWETGFILWSKEELCKFIKKVEDQITHYLKGEFDEKATSYAVTLLFHVVDFDNEENHLNYRKGAESYDLADNQFYALFSSNNPKESPYKKFGFLELIGYIKKVIK